MATGMTSVRKVGRASSARPDEPGVGLIIMTVHMDNCRAQTSKCPNAMFGNAGTTRATISAFNVMNRAVQLTNVADAASIPKRHRPEVAEASQQILRQAQSSVTPTPQSNAKRRRAIKPE